MVYTNRTYTNIPPPIEVLLVYNDGGLPEDFHRVAVGPYHWLDAAPTNKLAIMYRIQLEDGQPCDKVREALVTAFAVQEEPKPTEKPNQTLEPNHGQR